MEYFTVASSLDRRVVRVNDLPDRFSKYYELSIARPMGGHWPGALVLSMSRKDGDMLTDFIANPDRMLYVSSKARDVLLSQGIGGGEGEYLPFSLNDKQGRSTPEQFHVLNVLRSVACFDFERSGFSTYPGEPGNLALVESIHLREDKIPPEAKLFRLAEKMRFIIIRSDLLDAIKQAGLTGLRVLQLGEDVT